MLNRIGATVVLCLVVLSRYQKEVVLSGCKKIGFVVGVQFGDQKKCTLAPFYPDANKITVDGSWRWGDQVSSFNERMGQLYPDTE